MHLAYTWIVSHLFAKNYQNRCKFDEVLTKTNLLSFFGDTVYIIGESFITLTVGNKCITISVSYYTIGDNLIRPTLSGVITYYR